MDFKIVYYKDVAEADWNNWVNQIDETNLHHSWNLLNYYTKFPNIKEHLSFALLKYDNSPISICPLAVSYNEKQGIHEISFSGTPVGIPALADMKPSFRRKILDDIFKIIHDCCRKYDVKKIKMIQHPVNISCCQNKPLSNKNSFELLRYQMLYHVNNTIVIDLGLSEEELTDNISKYQRKNIRKAQKKNIYIRVFNKCCNREELKERFYRFQEIHFQAAGRKTRPQETWDAMYETALKGKASLFVAFVEETPISYLFCGEFSSMAFGWSQAHLKVDEQRYSPRHLLEWEAILYYKTREFDFYEVGERFYGPQLFYLPSEKEISISLFKERYGGPLLPKTVWTKYLENPLLENYLKNRLKDYFQAQVD